MSVNPKFKMHRIGWLFSSIPSEMRWTAACCVFNLLKRHTHLKHCCLTEKVCLLLDCFLMCPCIDTPPTVQLVQRNAAVIWSRRCKDMLFNRAGYSLSGRLKRRSLDGVPFVGFILERDEHSISLQSHDFRISIEQEFACIRNLCNGSSKPKLFVLFPPNKVQITPCYSSSCESYGYLLFEVL